jgi:hypothetical protein
VNNLLRKSTTTEANLEHISHKEEGIPKAFSRWLKNPTENWKLGTAIVKEIS